MEAMLQSQRIPWDKVHAQIDSELVTLQRVGGMMSHGPVNISDPRSLTDFSFSQLHRHLLQHAPNITSLISSIGQNSDVPASRDIPSLVAICLLAKKNSDKVKGFQLLLSLMLVARATSKQVITTLNHIGVCLSYRQTYRYVENTARAIEQSKELQTGHWIVAYDNMFKHAKKVVHERYSRLTESWNFTSRLGIKVANLPPNEYKDTAGVPQGNRQDLAVEDILPNDDDDIAFHHSRVKRVEKLLVERFKSCAHLTIKKQYETTEQ